MPTRSRGNPTMSGINEGSFKLMRVSQWKKIGLGAAAALLASGGSALAAAPPPDPLNSGDTAWMLTSSALVLLMTIPGLALFYGGMVRKKNVLATLAQSFGATCIITVLWMIIGYSVAFTPGSTVIGGVGRVFMAGMTVDSI